jgi:hypothetical protein
MAYTYDAAGRLIRAGGEACAEWYGPEPVRSVAVTTYTYDAIVHPG